MKVVRLSALHTGRLFSRRKYSWYSFLLEADSAPGSQCGRRNYVDKKFQSHHRESNPRLDCSAVPQPTLPPPAPVEVEIAAEGICLHGAWVDESLADSKHTQTTQTTIKPTFKCKYYLFIPQFLSAVAIIRRVRNKVYYYFFFLENDRCIVSGFQCKAAKLWVLATEDSFFNVTPKLVPSCSHLPIARTIMRRVFQTYYPSNEHQTYNST